MKKIILFLMFFVFCFGMFGQTKSIKGIVLDQSRMPMAGATIAVKGFPNTTKTDFDGAFEFAIPQNAESLIVSFIGYTSKNVAIENKSSFNIQLESSSVDMNEVIVVGYGKQKKVTLTGSVGLIKGEELNKRAVASLSTALQGTMPGVTVQQGSGEPGADGSNIRIRGIGSVNSNTFPLVLVDNVEMDMNQVDMNTVESVSVLKDAASASI